jgi:hypothetical protein
VNFVARSLPKPHSAEQCVDVSRRFYSPRRS